VPAGCGNLTRAREAAAILSADERHWPFRPQSLRPRPLRPRSLQPRKLSRELLSGKLRPRAERPVVWLSGEGSTARASGAGLRCPGLSCAHLAIAGEASPVLTAAVGSTGVGSTGVGSAVVPCADVRPAVGRRSRIWPTWVRTARPSAAVLLAAILPVDLRRAALRPTAGKLARVLHPRVLGRGRPDGRCGLRAAHDRALRPGTGGRHGPPAGSVAIGATVTRSRPAGRLTGETRPAGEPPRRGSGIAGRAGTAAHAVVTRTPGKPRTPIPRALATRQTGIASWTGAPADPGVGISPAFIIRPVFGVRPPTPAPPPREPCHTIDRRHPGDR
jgi:hypothetical protein